MSEEFTNEEAEPVVEEAPAELEGFFRRSEKEAEDVEAFNPVEEQNRRLGKANPTAVVYNGRGVYVDSASGTKFRRGVAVEVGKREASRLLALQNGQLFRKA